MSISNDNQAVPVSSIREEYRRLQEVDSFLSDIWQCEVQAYEHPGDYDGITNGAGRPSPALDTSASGGHRNRPNSDGTIADANVFPYHSALYPLLDCYDSIREDVASDLKQAAVPPSEAPDPLSTNGHRRSKFSLRLDPQGFHIEELGFLDGHLPNSAWAIRETLMPQRRREDYLTYVLHGHEADEDDEIIPVTEQHPNGQDQDATSLPRPRFWEILMNNNPRIASSNVSLAPDNEDDEHHDRDYETQKARHARNFSFLSWWEREIVSNPTYTLKSSPESKGATSLSTSFSAECLFATSPMDANLVLLRVLKHAMSDLQRDFRLARGVLLLIADWCLCDDAYNVRDSSVNSRCKAAEESSETTGEGIETLRRLLTIISSEYVHCAGFCHEWYMENGGDMHAAEMNANQHHAARNAHGDESIDLEETSDEDSDEWDTSYNAPLNDSRALDSPTHYCYDWFQVLGSLSTVLAYGIPFMTQQHTSVICAFVLREIDYVIGVSDTDRPNKKEDTDNGKGDAASEKTSLNSRYKGYLKQNLFLLNNSDSDTRRAAAGQNEGWHRPSENSGRQIHINLLIAIVNGLRRHAIADRLRLERAFHNLNAVSDGSTGDHDLGSSTLIERATASFNNCIEAIVDIGERVLLTLPTNSQTSLLGGLIVRAFLEAHIESEVLDTIGDDQLYLARDGNSHLRSIIEPLRYADAISNASVNPVWDPSHSAKYDDKNVASVSQLIGQPSQDVQDLVKGLFVRNLVDLRISGLGYGDFRVWLPSYSQPLAPEPLLFHFSSNFPHLPLHWVRDEEGNDLDDAGISSRYDFTLLLFLREWNRPWSPKSHLSFSHPFRSAVRQLALCAHRFGVPSDIVALVNSFLPRSWWPDDRLACWCRECQLLQLKDHFQAKISSRKSNWNQDDVVFMKPSYSPTTRPKTYAPLLVCKCNVALASSKDHMRYLHQEGHKRHCGLPPFRPFCEEDNAFCREVLGEHEDRNLLADENAEENWVEEGNLSDEDDDWESVHSDEELTEKKTMTEKILAFFEEKSYKHLR
ncbi:hypothetical protein HJC23_002044 [Cyclotella cryptica]|uniref:Uncharacterized protein n=1 Tax=Cyclotella cryptica TaxID=29204 RepID=A0ABD3Q6K2_9STRA